MINVLVARKILPNGRFSPALDDVFVALVDGMYEVKQRDHQAGGQAGTTVVGDAGTCNHFGHAKQFMKASIHGGFRGLSQLAY